MTFKLTRRQAIATSLAAPLVLSAKSATASAPMMGTSLAPFQRVKLGAFEVTTLLAGSATRPDPQTIFGMNVDADTFAQASAAANLPVDKTQFFFTPTLINTGAEVILFDTGLNAAGTSAAIEAAGYTADQVDTVVLTHMHGDHIGGLSGEAGETFSNARYIAGSAEYNHWDSVGNDNFNGKVKPLAEKITFLDDGGSVASGVTAMAAFGHTPGHMGYRIESDGQQLILGADFANHYVWSLGFPDWEVKFDMDKAAAAATRRSMLDMMAADKLPFVGYHMPWPAIGYVEKVGDGYRYVPHSYQLLM